MYALVREWCSSLLRKEDFSFAFLQGCFNNEAEYEALIAGLQIAYDAVLAQGLLGFPACYPAAARDLWGTKAWIDPICWNRHKLDIVNTLMSHTSHEHKKSSWCASKTSPSFSRTGWRRDPSYYRDREQYCRMLLSYFVMSTWWNKNLALQSIKKIGGNPSLNTLNMGGCQTMSSREWN